MCKAATAAPQCLPYHAGCMCHHRLVTCCASQDIAAWLGKLRLDLLPGEATAPLLSNPVRNGLLLGAIAAALTGQTLTAVAQPVNDIPTARYNLLRAAGHLGMVSVCFAAEAAAAAAENDREDALRASSPEVGTAGAAGAGVASGSPTSRGRSRSKSRSRSRGAEGRSSKSCSTEQSSSKSRKSHLSPTPSARRTPGAAAVDGAAFGSTIGGALGSLTPEAVGINAVAAAVATRACMSPRLRRRRRLQQQHHQHFPEPGRDWRQQRSCSPTAAPGGLLTSLCCECFAAAAAGGCSVIGSSAEAGMGCSCSCWCCETLPGGTVLEHAVFQLLEAVLAGDSGAMWGLLYALQQRCPAPATARQQLLQQQRRKQQQGEDNGGISSTHQEEGAAPAVLGYSSGTGLVSVKPLVGPSWRGLKLPYSAEEMDRWEGRCMEYFGFSSICVSSLSTESVRGGKTKFPCALQ